MRRKVLPLWIFVLAGAMTLSACAWFSREQSATSPQELYNEAMNLYGKKKYYRSAEAFRKFKEEYPLSDLKPHTKDETAQIKADLEAYGFKVGVG